jgi:hypothetical protein
MKKQTILIMVVIMIFFMPTLLSATIIGDLLGGLSGQIIKLLTPIIVLALTPVLIRWFRKLGIELENNEISNLITTIINLLVNIDLKNKEMSSIDKKKLAVAEVQRVLPKQKQNILEKAFGSIEAAVQWAFEKSSLAKKKIITVPTGQPN